MSCVLKNVACSFPRLHHCTTTSATSTTACAPWMQHHPSSLVNPTGNQALGTGKWHPLHVLARRAVWQAVGGGATRRRGTATPLLAALPWRRPIDVRIQRHAAPPLSAGRAPRGEPGGRLVREGDQGRGLGWWRRCCCWRCCCWRGSGVSKLQADVGGSDADHGRST